MDTRQEMRKLRVILVVGVLFVVSGVKSCGELRYTISGKATEGKFTDVQETLVSPRRGKRVVLTYEFKDAEEKTHQGEATVRPAEAVELLAEPVEVIYLPSNPETNTLTSQRSITWPVLFVIMLALLAAAIVWFHRQAHASGRRR